MIFITNYLLTLPFLMVLLFVGILFSTWDMDEVAIFAGLAAGTVAFFLFDFALSALMIFAAVYLVFGVIWSFWRYKRFVDVSVDRINATNSSYDKENFTNRMTPARMSGRITSWVLSWPFSMVENLIGDILRFIKNFVTKSLKAVYAKIHASALKNIKTKPVTE